ncbi:MAG: hypothetical protein Q8Q09_22140 [Deltaproteobacteria bacterium]|nr:hypothetical protein [Deltaproteobacteria bacterium]
MSFGFVVFLQPRVGQPAENPPANPGTDPGQTPPPNAEQPTTGTTPQEALPVPIEAGAPGTLEVNQQLCEAANRNMFISAAGYDAGALVVGLLVFFVMRRKLWGTFSVRMITAVLLAGLVGALLMGFDPVRADDLVRCLNSVDYRRYIWLQEANVARGLVLGLLPTGVLTALGCLGINRT